MNPKFQELLETIGVPTERWDDKYTATLERELDYIKQKTYDVVYPAFKARALIPVSGEAPPGAQNITYRQWDVFGMAQILANYADDIPLVEALAEEFTMKVHGIAAGYEYSIQDLRASAMSGNRLQERKATGARRLIEAKIEDMGARGAVNYGTTGLANNANVSLVTPTTGAWATATGQQMVADANKLVRAAVTAAKGTFAVDTLALGTQPYANFATKPMSTTGDTTWTALKFFLESNPWIKNVEVWEKLDDLDAAGTGPRAVVYAKDPEVLTLEIPQEFEQFAPQARNLSMFVPCHARVGGVAIHYPFAVAYMDGL